MNLNEILPKSKSFKLAMLNDTLKVKPVTLSDEIWLVETFGVDGVQKIFEQVKFSEISKIVWRLLDNKSKAKLKKQVVVVYNDEGEETEHKLGGVELLNSLISGWGEKEEIIAALLASLGFTDNMLDEIAESSGKKKVQ